jgi:Flp pilus assembly protein TadD
VVHRWRRDSKASLANLTKALELNPTNSVAYNDRAWQLYELGALDQALTDANLAVALAPKDPYVFGTRGWIEFSKGNTNQAVANCSRAIELGSNTSAAFFDGGLLHSIAQEYDQRSH